MLLLLAATALADPPADVARTYAEASTSRDLDALRGVVSERCHETAIGRGAPLRVLDAPLDVASLDLEEPVIDGAGARVRYRVVGSVRDAEIDTTTDLLGKSIRLQLDGITLERIELSGEIALVRHDETWKVTCPPAASPPLAE